MTTANQGMSIEEIEQIVAQRVANAIEAIAIYESINQTKQRENKVAGNASNKRKWEGDHNGSFSQQQNKEHKVFRAHTVRLSNKEDYAGNLPWCNRCNFHHIGQCAEKCGNCKLRGHQARDCRIPVPRAKQRSVVSGKKAEVTCYGCGDQPNVEAASKHDWFKKQERPPTPDPDWNAGKQIDFRPPQSWISQIAKAEKPPLTFDELMSTPIDFSAFVMNHLKIDNLTQQHLVRPTFNLLKGSCKSRVELEYHFEECYKAVTDRLDWTNPEGHQYPFDLSKPLPLIEVQGRQVVPADYFINNDLEYLKGGSCNNRQFLEF
ncbi:hypothetical protein Tco_0271524 [Tanacetum coccineum]